MCASLAISDLELSNNIDAHGLCGKIGVEKPPFVTPEIKISSNSAPSNASY